jgi:flagellar biosynthesis/type III secretory pathway protein FliH
MTLTPDLEAEFETAIIQYEEKRQMDYITSIERRGRETGFSKGLEEGLEEGLERSILRILRQRFGEAPEEIAEKLATLPAATLEALIDEAITARSLDAFADEITAVSLQDDNTQ